MDADRWRRVSEVFDEAVGLPHERRGPFLARVCADDPELQREVESLLAADARTGMPPEVPAIQAAAALFEDPPTLAPGERIGTYLVEREIARGGMGVVYRAVDERLGRAVALKALGPTTPRGAATRERFRREARAAAMLSHPAIAVVYALEERGEDLFIVSELLEGRTLRARLDEGPLRPEEAVRIGLQIAQGLTAAHARGIIHRDLKPDNVMLVAGQPTVKILDFGIARVEAFRDSPPLTVSGLLLGTPGYMAPEQLRGEQVDARTDIFAFGAVLYELLTGSAPFGRGSTPSVVAAALEREPPPLTGPTRDVPEGLAQIVRRCLEKHPEDRFQRAEALVAALEGLEAAPDPAGAADPPPAGSGRALWWWRFHETTAAVAHWLMLVPAWQLVERLPEHAGRALFVALVAAASATGVLRLHLAFVARHEPPRLEHGLERFGSWLRWGDRAFVALLTAGGVAIAGTAAGLGSLLIALAVGSLVASHVVEPSTADSALRALRRSSAHRRAR